MKIEKRMYKTSIERGEETGPEKGFADEMMFNRVFKSLQEGQEERECGILKEYDLQEM